MNKSAGVSTFLFLLSISLFAQTYYGMTAYGGQSGGGTIFSIKADGSNYSVRYQFQSPTPGSEPTYLKLIEVNGKFYGATEKGGIYNNGVFFEYDYNSKQYKVIINFDGLANGSRPMGSLLTASNGKIYGRTISGADGFGTLYEYNVSTHQFRVVYAFQPGDLSTGFGGVVEGSVGKLYGLGYGTHGDSSHGTIWEYDLSTNTYSLKYNIPNYSLGDSPVGELLLAPNGKFYGVTNTGGLADGGVLFEFDPNSLQYTMKKYLREINGYKPQGGLTLASDGKIYGTTSGGGSWGFGIVFDYDYINDICTRRKEFLLEGKDPAIPIGTLAEGADGKLYGLTERTFGSNSSGTIFNFNPVDNIITAYDSYVPTGSPLLAANGKMYFPSGVGDGAILFLGSVNDNEATIEFIFNDFPEGGIPKASFTQAFNGKFYGLTDTGGTGGGVIFEFNPSTNSYSRKVSLGGSPDYLGQPTGNFLLHPNGKLYALLKSWPGSIIEFDPSTGTITRNLKIDDSKGNTPLGSLTLASDGRIFGMTSKGGANDKGVIFEFDLNSFKVKWLADFNGLNGQNPEGTLISLNGKLYGTTHEGGQAASAGTFFEFDPLTQNINLLENFTSAKNGLFPGGNIIAGANGKIYGGTLFHTSGGGSLWEYDFNGPYMSNYAFNFPETHGNNPISFTWADNGNVIGLTSSGGAHNQAGTLFSYNPISWEVTYPFSFNYINGANPVNNSLIRAKQNQVITIPFTSLNKIYGDIDFTIPALSSSGLPVAFTSSNSDVAVIQDNKIRITGAGSTTISIWQTGNDSYFPSYEKVTVNVAKASLTITAVDNSKEYGDSNPDLVRSYSGFVGSDNAGSIDVLPGIDCTADKLSPVGNYIIALSGGSDDDYNLILANGTLAVTKAILKVSAGAKLKIYGESNPVLTLTYDGFKNAENEDALDVAPSAAVSTNEYSPAGEYPITINEGSDENYQLNYFAENLIILPAPLHVTANDQTRNYGEDNPKFTFNYSGFLNGDDASGLDTQPQAFCVAYSLSPPGSYAINLSTLPEDNNYTFIYHSGMLVVTRATQTITVNAMPTFTAGDPEYPLVATSSSGLTVVLESSNTDVVMITTDKKLSIISAGQSIITASQPGDQNYEPAEIVQLPVVVKEKEIIQQPDTNSENPPIEDNNESNDSEVVTAIEAMELPQISLFPNPVSDKFTYLSDSSLGLTLIVFDTMGKEVLQRNLRGDDEIEVSTLANGIYYAICYRSWKPISKITFLKK
jgi:uncharacterized repeat protein (TIGR03803 family)